MQLLLLSALAIGCNQPKPMANGNDNSSSDVRAANGADSMLTQLSSDPQFVWLATLKQLYPTEFEVVRQTMQEQINNGAAVKNARIATFEAIKPFMARHQATAKAASDDHLVEYLRRNTLVAEALGLENLKACTDVFHGNLDPEIRPR